MREQDIKIASLLILNLISRSPMGRYTMSIQTNLSKAKVRSVLSRLKELNLVQTDGKSSGRRGTSLTDSGRELLLQLGSTVEFYFNVDDLKMEFGTNEYCVAHIEMHTDLSVLDLRDTMVRHGAKGAIIVEWDAEHKMFVFPGDRSEFQLESQLPIKKSGTLIIGFGENKGAVNFATCAVVLDILGEHIDQFDTVN